MLDKYKVLSELRNLEMKDGDIVIIKYLEQEATVVYTSKDGKTNRIFPALEWLAAMCSHIPNRGEQMIRYSRFCTISGAHSSIGNAHINS